MPDVNDAYGTICLKMELKHMNKIVQIFVLQNYEEIRINL